MDTSPNRWSIVIEGSAADCLHPPSRCQLSPIAGSSKAEAALYSRAVVTILDRRSAVRKLLLVGCLLAFAIPGFAAKRYSYFRLGNANDVTTSTTAGTVVMG